MKKQKVVSWGDIYLHFLIVQNSINLFVQNSIHLFEAIRSLKSKQFILFDKLSRPHSVGLVGVGSWIGFLPAQLHWVRSTNYQ